MTDLFFRARVVLVWTAVFVVVTGCSGDRGTSDGSSRHDQPPLTLLCAAGLRAPIDAIVDEYRDRFDVEVDVTYGGSGTLLSTLRVNPAADLYLAGDDSYIERARAGDLVEESIPVARMTAVIVVRPGNPRAVTNVVDLRREDVAVALADPEAAAIGRVTRSWLEAAGLWDGIRRNVRVFKPTVNEVATDVHLGAVDAAIVWDVTAARFPELEVIEFAHAPTTQITIGVTSSTQRSVEAFKLARFIAGEEAGLDEFRRHGFEVLPGDPFEPRPALRVFSGAMLRPGLDGAIERFRAREGIDIDTVYNGCGILVAQMRQGAMPEAYFACDTSFMDVVADRFEASQVLTANEVVIAVSKENPRAITSLSDLTRDGLRIGLAHETHSALGHLTAQLLEELGVAEAMKRNCRVDSATGDLLVNQLRAGSLDAVIVYRSNAVAHGPNADHLACISIDHPLARAEQPYAVRRDTKYPRAMARFLRTVRTAESRAKFEAAGFDWKSAR